MSHCHVSYRRVTLVCATPGVVFSAGAESPVSGNLHEVPVCWFESGVVLAQNSQLVSVWRIIPNFAKNNADPGIS